MADSLSQGLSYETQSEVPIEEARKIIAITVGCGLAAFAVGLVIVYHLYMRRWSKIQGQKKKGSRGRDLVGSSGCNPPKDYHSGRSGGIDSLLFIYRQRLRNVFDSRC